ncbi:MAG: riboflavin biosynthesis protein RibF [Candidatus Omnitrophica bacterium]|nr:riboflavin biosynthesis protein RibF [Candidatus Omnitrophota bacterium]
MLVQKFNSFRRDVNFSSVIGIGKFDGLHVGHQKIISSILKISKKIGATPSMFIIKNYPTSFVLMEWEQKIKMIEKSGIEVCLWADFKDIKFLSDTEFLEKLYLLLNFKAVCVGSNFKFGHNRSGDIDYLNKWAGQKGVSVHLHSPVRVEGRIVSSTVIKELISRADFKMVRRMLGRWYGVAGLCIHGYRIGRMIGFPTINLELKNWNSPLSHGVYICVVKKNEQFYKGVLFYGKSETFGLPVSFEIHIIDSNIPDTYGDDFFVFPLKKIRQVRKFQSASNLVERIKKDIIEAKNFFSEFNLTEFKKECKI